MPDVTGANRTLLCEGCGTELREDLTCGSCELYNAAVSAQKAAAIELAKARVPGFSPTRHRAWLNEHGVFAQTTTTHQIGSIMEAHAFATLTRNARLVTMHTEPVKKKARPRKVKP